MSLALFIGRQESVPLAQYYQRHDYRDCTSLRYRARLPSRLIVESVPRALPVVVDTPSKKFCLKEPHCNDLFGAYSKRSVNSFEHVGLKELDMAEWIHQGQSQADFVDSGCASLVTSPGGMMLYEDLCHFNTLESGQEFAPKDENAFNFFKHSNDSEDLFSESDSAHSSAISKDQVEDIWISNCDKKQEANACGLCFSSEEELQAYDDNLHAQVWKVVDKHMQVNIHRGASSSPFLDDDSPSSLDKLRDTYFAEKKKKTRKKAKILGKDNGTTESSSEAIIYEKSTSAECGEKKHQRFAKCLPNQMPTCQVDESLDKQTEEQLTRPSHCKELNLFVGAELRLDDSSSNKAHDFLAKNRQENSFSQQEIVTDKSGSDECAVIFTDLDDLCSKEQDISLEVGFQEVIRKKSLLKRVKNQQLKEHQRDNSVCNNPHYYKMKRDAASFMTKECVSKKFTLSDYERELTFLQVQHPNDYPVDHDKVAHCAFRRLQTRLRADFSALERRIQPHRRTGDCYAK